MGLLTSSLQIGRSALLSYQAALQVVGNNMANAGNPEFTRQTAVLEAIPGVRFAEVVVPVRSGSALPRPGSRRRSTCPRSIARATPWPWSTRET